MADDVFSIVEFSVWYPYIDVLEVSQGCQTLEERKFQHGKVAFIEDCAREKVDTEAVAQNFGGP